MNTRKITMKTTIAGPEGYSIDLDPSQIFPDNPGEGTPAIVYSKGWKRSASYWCAVETGEVDGVEISPKVVAWLEDLEGTIEAMMEEADERRHA